MKKYLIPALAVLGLFLLPKAVRAGSSGRKLTLMVYMCGSSLESGYGAASLRTIRT